MPRRSHSSSIPLIGGPVGPGPLRELLVRLGPTFVKLGQFLALRPDLIPQEYCDELLSLTDLVPSFPWHDARRILTEDLGAEPEQRFAWINPHPVAAGSLAQVHLARTHDGRELAIKVQRAGIHERVARDLRRGRLIARVIRLIGLPTPLDPEEVLAEFRRWLDEELDFERELRNLSRMYELLAEHPYVRIPRPEPELSGPRVVSAEHLRGVPFSELLRLVRAGEPERVDRLGFDREVLAQRLIGGLLTQIFELHFFHADTHPGNLLALPGNQIGFLDFGLVDKLDETIREKQMRYQAAVYSGKTEEIYRALTEVLVQEEVSDLSSFRDDFFAETRSWSRERETEKLQVGRSSVAHYLIGVLGAARRNRLRVPAEVLSLYRALLTAETVALQLSDEPLLLSVGSRYFSRLQIRQALESLYPDQVWPLVVDLVDLLKNGPPQLQRVLSDLANDRLTLPVRLSESKASRRQANSRARLVTASVFSVGVSVLLVGSGDRLLAGSLPLADVLWGVLAMVYVLIVILWRRLK